MAQSPWVGTKPRGYRLADKYFFQGSRSVNVGGSLGKKATKAREYEFNPQNQTQEMLAAWLKRITVDMDKVEELLAAMPFDPPKKKGKRKEKMTREAKVMLFRKVAELIRDGRLVFKGDDPFGNRIHTNVSNFPKIMRPALRIDGEPMVNVDIACSQPYFLAVNLKKYEHEWKNLAESKGI